MHQFSHSVVSDCLWPHVLQHTSLPCPSPTSRACSNSCPLSQWCHPTILSSVVPFFSSVQFSSSVLSDFATPWTAARQASLSITNFQSLLELMSIELVMPSNHLIFFHPLLFLPLVFPSSRIFSMSQFFASGGQSIGVSASASVLSMNIQDWSPLEWTGLISLLSKGLSRVFSNIKV